MTRWLVTVALTKCVEMILFCRFSMLKFCADHEESRMEINASLEEMGILNVDIYR